MRGIKTDNYDASFIQKWGAAIFLLVMVIFNCIFTNNFLSPRTLWLLVVQAFPIAIVGLGMTFVISSGGIDISVGATMALTGTILAAMMVSGIPLIICIFVALLVGIIVGAVNGFFIAKFEVQPIVMTLVTMLAIRGFAQVVTNGRPVPFSYTPLNTIASYRFWKQGMPLQFALILLFTLLAVFIIKNTVFGSQIQCIGNNRKAANFTGIDTFKITALVYIISAFAAGIASVIEVGRESQAEAARMGISMEMNAIAAVAVGGTSLNGGKAYLWGTIIGALIMQLVVMTVNMNGILSSWGKVAKATILILAVIPNVYRKKD
jgi:ribose/xylose/arabinose/galactoside ABC-type transport system permease subunit